MRLNVKLSRKWISFFFCCSSEKKKQSNVRVSLFRKMSVSYPCLADRLTRLTVRDESAQTTKKLNLCMCNNMHAPTVSYTG